MPGPPHMQPGAGPQPGVMQPNQQMPGPVVVMQPGQMMPVGHPGMMARHIQPGQVPMKVYMKTANVPYLAII